MTDERIQELQNHHNPIVAAWFRSTQITLFYNEYKVTVNGGQPKQITYAQAIERQLTQMNMNADFPVGFKSVEWEYKQATEYQKLEFKEILILVHKEETAV